MVVGRKAKLLSLLIFSSIDMIGGWGLRAARVRAIGYIAGSHENWLKSCYLAHSVCMQV